MTKVDLDSSVAVSSFDTPEVADHLEGVGLQVERTRKSQRS